MSETYNISRPMLKELKKYPFTLLIAAIVLYLSFFNPPKTDMDEIPFMDKVVHICMYGGLCGTLWIEYLRSHKNRFSRQQAILTTILIPVLFSGAIELGQQYLTANRSGDWLDLMANSIGVLLAALFGYYILRPQINKPS